MLRRVAQNKPDRAIGLDEAFRDRSIRRARSLECAGHIALAEGRSSGHAAPRPKCTACRSRMMGRHARHQ